MSYIVTVGLHVTPLKKRIRGQFGQIDDARMFLRAYIERDGFYWSDECDTTTEIVGTALAASFADEAIPFAVWCEWHDDDLAYPQLYEILEAPDGP